MKAPISRPARLCRRVRRIAVHFVIILLTTTGAALADNSVKLQIAAKSDFNDPKNSVQEIQDRWLEITATAFHLDRPAAVRLEWTFYADDLSARKVIKHASGNVGVELVQGQRATLKTKSVRFDFTPRHSVRTGSGRRARFKVIEAAGVRYHAWAVRAFIGDQLAGEAYSMPAIKKLLDGGK